MKPRPTGVRGEESNLFFLKRGVGGKLVSPYSPKANFFETYLNKFEVSKDFFDVIAEKKEHKEKE